MTARRLAGQRLVIASHNPGKVIEIAALLAPFGVEVVAADSLGLPEPDETGDTFEANALLKAVAAAEASGLPALSDDSGLVVPALDGDPGIRSARWAGPERDFGIAMARVQASLAGKEDRRAHFICVLCVAWPDGEWRAFEGRVDGRLVWPPRGDPSASATIPCSSRRATALPLARWIRRKKHRHQPPGCRLSPSWSRPWAGDSGPARLGRCKRLTVADEGGFGLYVHWPFLPGLSAPTATSTATYARPSTRIAGASALC